MVEPDFLRKPMKHLASSTNDPIPVERQVNHDDEDQRQADPFVKRNASGAWYRCENKAEKEKDVPAEFENALHFSKIVQGSRHGSPY